MEVSGHIHAPTALFPGERYPVHILIGWVGLSRCGRGGEENPCPCRESKRSRPARTLLNPDSRM